MHVFGVLSFMTVVTSLNNTRDPSSCEHALARDHPLGREGGGVGVGVGVVVVEVVVVEEVPELLWQYTPSAH